MKNNLNDPQSTQSSDEKSASVTHKAPYSSPVLQCYGAVGKLTQGGGFSGADAMGMMMMASDPRAKQNIVRVGDHPLGIGLYLFDYLPQFREQWGHGRQFGVMADEVEAVMPEAVVVHADGYKAVNYGMLGISHTVH